MEKVIISRMKVSILKADKGYIIMYSSIWNKMVISNHLIAL